MDRSTATTAEDGRSDNDADRGVDSRHDNEECRSREAVSSSAPTSAASPSFTREESVAKVTPLLPTVASLEALLCTLLRS